MNLQEYDGKQVLIKLKSGCVCCGYVGDYISKEDNNYDDESVVIDFPYGIPIEFPKSDILAIYEYPDKYLVKAKFLGKTDSLILTNSQIYDVYSIEKGWFRVVDNSGKDCLYRTNLFEIVEWGYFLSGLKSGVSNVCFRYNEKPCGMETTVQNTVVSYKLWSGNITRETKDFNEAMLKPFFGRKSLFDVMQSVEVKYY